MIPCRCLYEYFCQAPLAASAARRPARSRPVRLAALPPADRAAARAGPGGCRRGAPHPAGPSPAPPPGHCFGGAGARRPASPPGHPRATRCGTPSPESAWPVGPGSGVAGRRGGRPATLPEGLPAHGRPGGACPPVGPWDSGAPPSRPGAPRSQPAGRGSAQTAQIAGACGAPAPAPRPWVTPLALWPWLGPGAGARRPPPRHAGRLHRVGRHAYAGADPRRPGALPRSRVPPVQACPALRPRWCPGHSPGRIQASGLPATARRRLCPLSNGRLILGTTTLQMSGLHHAACGLVPASFVRP